MFSNKVVPALAALGLATGAAAASCSASTTTIVSQAEATALAACSTFSGSVVVATGAPSTVDIGGELKEITGDFTAENNGQLVTLQSSSLATIGGDFLLSNLTLLSTLSFSDLTTVGSISWTSLTTLSALSFGDTGVTSADSVTISDTFLSSLNGINVDTLSSMNINNNKKLVDFSTQLGNLSDALYISANGQNLTVDFPNLIWIANMTIANVTSFSAPSLETVNGSMAFDSNYFESISFPNLTSSGGDISFVSNPDATNITAPQLTKCGGGFTVANNTALMKLNGFNKLKSVGGAVVLRGSFSEVSLPALDDVKGALDVTSTEDIDDSCSAFKALNSNGGNGDIQGSYTCTSNNTLANNSTGQGDDNGSSGSGDKKSAAFSITSGSSISTVISLATVGALVSAFL